MPTPIPPHIQSGVKRQAIPIHYLTSKDGSGRDCWYVLICPDRTLKEMLATRQCVRPEDYGYVVASGFGAAPPADTQAMLIEDFNFDITKAG